MGLYSPLGRVDDLTWAQVRGCLLAQTSMPAGFRMVLSNVGTKMDCGRRLHGAMCGGNAGCCCCCGACGACGACCGGGIATLDENEQQLMI